MTNLKERLKKLEAPHKGRKVYIFTPDELVPDNCSDADLVKIPGVWRSVKGEIPPPILTDKDHVIVDDIEVLLNERAKKMQRVLS